MAPSRSAVALLFALIFASSCTEAVTFFVSTSGSDSNTGSLAAPFATIERAFQSPISPALTINIFPGLYNMSSSLPAIQNGKFYSNPFSISPHSLGTLALTLQGSGQNGSTVITCASTALTFLTFGTMNATVFIGNLSITGCSSVLRATNYNGAVFLLQSSFYYNDISFRFVRSLLPLN